ncbi:MAG: hypothetical protein KTR31_38720 [Myxococcales bacterium]|nr:hypothetical protein [Myxococcales bacterium]
MSARSALADLLMALFTPAELRRHLDLEPRGPELLAALPTAGASEEETSQQAARALMRSGAVDDAFFDRLREARPGQEASIEGVREAWRMRRRSPVAIEWARVRTAFVLGGLVAAILVAAIWWATRPVFLGSE